MSKSIPQTDDASQHGVGKGWVVKALSAMIASSSIVLVFFWLIGFQYTRVYTEAFNIGGLIERPLHITASVGSEVFIEFVRPKIDLLIPLIASLVIFYVIAILLRSKFHLELASWSNSKAKLLVGVLAASVIAFLILGWLPYAIGRSEAYILIDQKLNRIGRCVRGEQCVTYRTRSYEIKGIEVMSDRDRIFVGYSEGVKVISIADLESISQSR